jgi:2'-5' RNA ligase
MDDLQDWTRRHADQLRNHWWWRPGWSLGKRFYTWHLTFDGAEDLHKLVDTYKAVLKGIPGLDPVPQQWLHLTMQGVGFTDQIREDDLNTIIEAVEEELRRLPAVDLTFQRAVVRPESVALPPSPADAVARIRSAIRAGIRDATGDVPESETGFQPHVSLAYHNRDGASADIITALQTVSPKPVVVRVDSAALIELNRDNSMYEWRTVKELRMTRGSQQGS